jgi:predicted nuclease of predicted toxin-antitoxin system
MGLRLLCDECVGDPLFNSLKKRFDVVHVRQVNNLGSGTSDQKVWMYAVKHDYNIFTSDKDFINGSANPNNGTNPGVIRYDDTEPSYKIRGAMKNIEGSVSSQGIANQSLKLFVPGSW